MKPTSSASRGGLIVNSQVNACLAVTCCNFNHVEDVCNLKMIDVDEEGHCMLFGKPTNLKGRLDR